jgi:hypothetical protein
MPESVRAGRMIASTLILLLLTLSLSACNGIGVGGSNAVIGPDRVRVRNSTASASHVVGELNSGDVVRVEARGEEGGVMWAKISGPNGVRGWIEDRHLVKQEVVDQSRQLAAEIQNVTTQAIGRSKATLKLRSEPDRTSEGNVIIVLPAGTELEIVGRQRKPRPSSIETQATAAEGESASASPKFDEWLQVRIKNNKVTPAGWIYGGSVELQIPPEIIYYVSSGRRIVGWQRLGEAGADDSAPPPHYVVIERNIFNADPEADFDRVKLLAYDPAQSDYYTPFREDIKGRLPMIVSGDGSRGRIEIKGLESDRTVSFQIAPDQRGRLAVTREGGK